MKEYIVKWSHVNTMKFPEELIRCKDCKWYEPRIKRCNNSKSTEWKPDDYCSDAERKDE